MIAIDGVPAEEVRRRLTRFVSAENRYAGLSYTGYIRNATALLASGISHSLETAEFRLEKDGREFTVAAASRNQKLERTPEWTMKTPSFENRSSEYYWFEYLAPRKTLYVQYNSCQEMRNLPFAKFVSQVLDAARRENPEKLVIDLRNNGGGNSEVIAPLFQAMTANQVLRPRGGIYVLVATGTFSSGTLAAVELRKRFQAMLVGEPMAQRPNSYGDVRYFRLPNSQTNVSYSTKRFALAEGDPEALDVELPVPMTAADYFAGRDAALEATLALPASLETNLRSAIRKNPHCASAWLSLFSITKDPKTLRAGVDANPRTAELRMELGRYYCERKNYAESRRVLAGDPGSPGVAFQLAQTLLAEGKTREAADAYRQSYRMDPENMRGLLGLADIFVKQNNVDEALRLIDKEAAWNPRDADVPLLAANVAAKAGRWDAAIGAMQTAITRLEQRHGETFEIRLKLSEIYRRSGKPEEAVRAFREGCDAMSDTMRGFGANYVGMVMGPMAAEYEGLLRQHPEDPVLMHNLAFVLSAAERDTGRALDLARRAHELLPSSDEAADDLGMIYVARKEWPPALEIFRALVARAPAVAGFHYHLALALRATAGPQSAAPELRQALRLGPKPDDKRQIETLLAK